MRDKREKRAHAPRERERILRGLRESVRADRAKEGEQTKKKKIINIDAKHGSKWMHNTDDKKAHSFGLETVDSLK